MSSATASFPVPNQFHDPAWQSFLRVYVRKTLLLTKLRPPDDSLAMDTDEMDLNVPDSTATLDLDDSIIAHMKTKLGHYYSSKDLHGHVDEVQHLTHAQIIQAAQTAETDQIKSQALSQNTSKGAPSNADSNDPSALQSVPATQRTLILGQEDSFKNRLLIMIKTQAPMSACLLPMYNKPLILLQIRTLKLA